MELARHPRVRLSARARVDADTHQVRAGEVRIPPGARLGTNTGTFDNSLDRRGRSGLGLVRSSTRVARRRTTAATGERAWAFPIGRSERNEGLPFDGPSRPSVQRSCCRLISGPVQIQGLGFQKFPNRIGNFPQGFRADFPTIAELHLSGP